MFKADNLPDSCPPSEAIEQEVENVYRLVSSPPTEDNFMNHVEANIPFNDKLLCEANALSFFTTLKKAQQTSKMFKKYKKPNIHFYCGNISTECGRHRTKNKHLNLWVYKDVDIKSNFMKEGELIENH